MDIKDQISAVLRKYPHLRYEEGTNSLIGELYITENDSYEVKIVLDRYPSNIPLVYETEGRIPKKAHRHVYTNTK